MTTAFRSGPGGGTIWDVGEIPFHVGPRSTPSNSPFPDLLSMRVTVDEELGALVQVADDAVRAALGEAYAVGSQIGTPLSRGGAGQPALEDFLAFVREARGGRGLVGANVLEIGCGTGALLGRIAAEGARACGIEPGAHAAERAREAGLDVIADEFDPARFAHDPLDLIVHHTVLEHIVHPVRFLAEQLALLADDGCVVCAVPDDSLSIVHGDLSLLVHEHFIYITPAVMRRLATRAGAHVVAMRQSRTAGATYFQLRRAPLVPDTAAGEQAVSPASGFVRAAERGLTRIGRFCELLLADRRTMGVYCPARFINYHALLESSLPSIRYFDDDSVLHGRYFPPFNVPVESRQALIDAPVTDVLVMSWTFGESVAASLRSCAQLAETRIHTLADLMCAY